MPLSASTLVTIGSLHAFLVSLFGAKLLNDLLRSSNNLLLLENKAQPGKKSGRKNSKRK